MTNPGLSVVAVVSRVMGKWLSPPGKKWQGFSVHVDVRLASFHFVSLCGSAKGRDEGRLSGSPIWLKGAWFHGAE